MSSKRLRTRSRQLQALAFAAVVLASVVAAIPGNASTAPVGSYGLRATAQGNRITGPSDISGSVPDVETSFETGAIGYARGSITWPGPLLSNGGTLVVLLAGPQAPPGSGPIFDLLNYPVRAEARGPGGPAEDRFDQIPGITMTAAADESSARGHAAVQRVEMPGVGDLGSASTSAMTRLVDDGGEAKGESTVTAINVAGVLKIDSIRSVAEAFAGIEDGKASARTTLGGVEIAGQPVTIDQDGLRVSSQGEPVPVGDAANEAAKQTLAQAGITVVVTKPIVESGPGSARAVAGAVLIQAGATGPIIVYGGATAEATVSEGIASDTGGPVDIPGSTQPELSAGGLPSEVLTAIPVATPESKVTRPVVRTAAEPIAAFLRKANLTALLLGGALLALLSSRVLRSLADSLLPQGETCNAEGTT